MQLLSKTAEQHLISAIERAAGLVNDGMTPNDAIVKSATDARIPAGHLDLMVHAYNTGRTTKQRETGEDTLEKAADFTLADIKIIRAALYPETVKTSAQLTTDSIVSTEYAVAPTSFIQQRQKAASRGEMQKQAFAPTWTPPPRDEHAAVMRAHSEKQAAVRAVEELRRQTTETYTKAAAKMDELATYFRQPGHVPFADVLADVKLTHGDTGVLVMQKLANVYPALEKEAAKNYRILPDTTARNLVGEVISLVDAYNDANTAYMAKTASAAQPEKKSTPEITTGSILFRAEDEPLTLKEAAISGLDTMRLRDGSEQKVRQDPTYHPTFAQQQQGYEPGFRPFGAAYREPPAAPPDKPGLPQKPSEFNGFVTPIKTIGGIMGMGGEKEKADPTAKKRTAYNELDDQGFDSAIKSIRAKSVLHDLILNDPVISGHDPQDVAMAFNDISELAPTLVDTPGMLQTVLRKRLESGQLADFDVKQILEMDKLRAERDKAHGEVRRLAVENM